MSLRPMLLLVPSLICASTQINISGKIVDSNSSPIAGAVVTLTSEGLLDTTDADGNYEIIGRSTAIEETQIHAQSSLTVHGNSISVSLTEKGPVSIELYSLSGRQVVEPARFDGVKGSQMFSPFANTHLAAGIYIMQVTTNEFSKSSKLSIGTNSTAFATAPSIQPQAKHSSRSLDVESNELTLEVTKDDQKIMDIPITSYIEEVPTSYIVQRNISGTLSDRLLAEGSSLRMAIEGTEITTISYRNLWYNSGINGYSGYIYTKQSGDPYSYSIHIDVLNSDSLLTGRSETITFDENAGDIIIPSFDPENSEITHSITGPTTVVQGDIGLFERSFLTPETSPILFRWDENSEDNIEWNDSLATNETFEITFLELGTQTVSSQITDNAGRVSKITKEVTVVEPAQHWNEKGEAPITIAELDSLSKTPDFYNESFRPAVYDSLGVHGGTNSAAIYDSWKGTQLQIALPSESFIINGAMRKFSQEYTPKSMYWMGLAMMQELVNIDMQLYTAMGAKETYSGLDYDNSSLFGSRQYGPFHIEGASGLDRALAYPKFFPQYEDKFTGSLAIPQSGINSKEFMDFYHTSDFQLGGAEVVNNIFIAQIIQSVNYDILDYSTSIFWNEAISANTDAYLGVYPILQMYNQAAWGAIENISSVFSTDNWQTTASNPNASGLFGVGNNNYRVDILDIVQKLVDASRESLTDETVAIMDAQIPLEDLLALFFGDSGTADIQGDGGFLLHYSLSSQEREAIHSYLTEAFNLLKGRAPSTLETETVSLRYDFLPILRTVKNYFDNSREKPQGGDAITLIPQYSN